jgi:ribosomal protein L11 methylase PrmA
VVKRGPFSGVEFIEQTFHRHITPKLIGSYESELHNIWNTILSREYSNIINIGSAEGYYSVGLASHFKHVDVIAFDTDPWARRMTRLMAERNGVSNLTIRGTCTEEWLNSHLDQGAFILSDCEGCEESLMNPVDIPSLCFCDILIELHEAASSGVTERIKNRFSDSHHLTLIGRQKVQPENYPELRDLSLAEKKLAVSELRFCENHKWLYCIPK